MQHNILPRPRDAANPTKPKAHATPWYTDTVAAVSDFFQVESARGLSEAEAHQRLAESGPNRLAAGKRESLWQVFLEEVREPLILLLLLTGVLYTIWGSLADAVTIFAVILFVIGLEIFNESRAKRAITALQKLAEATTTVRRDGRPMEVAAEDVVPGDVLLLEAGRRVSADARLVEAHGLAVDESALTGESIPVGKEPTGDLRAETPLAERHTLVFAGTPVVRGRGVAIVVATGAQTEVGRIAGVAGEVKAPRTPLQVAMGQLSRTLVWVALGFSLVVPLLAWLLAHLPLKQAVLTGLSLAFATIPEELPIIITMVLALGAYRLSRERAIVKRLQAVETLGGVTVIATDKTGTLTQNQMSVTTLVPPELAGRMLDIGTLCNNAAREQTGSASDPLEVALLEAARAHGSNVEELRRVFPLRDEFPFETTRKLMSVVYAREGSLWSAVKGAPESVLARSSGLAEACGEHPLAEVDRKRIREQAAALAGKGLRVIAFAEKALADAEGRPSQDEAESDLTFVGLVALQDLPRSEAKEAIAACRTAGIRPVLVTGDHPLTARAIAEQVGLSADGRVVMGPELDALSDEALREVAAHVSLYARTTPEHKLRLVQALQADGERVAVTGDGINDAPALAAADIGVAMGESGTDVAREAADMVLADDHFATIVRAIEEGRHLFKNLQKGVRYYLAVKVALVSVTLLPVLLFIPVPFAPVQIILMELFMDVAASATFVSEPAEPFVMRQPPRDPKVPFMNRAMVQSIFSAAAGQCAAVSLVYLITWYSGAGLAVAQTAAFVTWLLGHVLLALSMRSERTSLVRLGFFSNRVMLWWALATVLFVLAVTFIPPVQALFKTAPLPGWIWLLAVVSTLVGTGWREVRKGILARQ